MTNDNDMHFDRLLDQSQRIIAARIRDLEAIGAPIPDWDEIGDTIMLGIFALAALN